MSFRYHHLCIVIAGAVWLQFKRCSNGEQFGFFGVFDGHGGPGAAEFVKSHLFIKLEGHPSFPTDMSTALSVSQLLFM